MIFTFLLHGCDLLVEIFNFLVLGPFDISDLLRQHLLIRPQNLNFIFIGTDLL